MQVPHRPGEGIGSPGAGVPGGWLPATGVGCGN